MSSTLGRTGAETERTPAGTAGKAMDSGADIAQGGASVDDQALAAMDAEFGDRAVKLPPVAIVIAAYNEEGPIGGVVRALPETVCGLPTAALVVVDGSSDRTADEARAAGALVCDVPVNRGQGAALRLGYLAARRGGAQYIVTTDADGQYNPAEIERLLEPILAGEADFATGSRKLGSQETRDPIRRLGVLFFAASISMLTGQRITDTTFGLRVMRSEVTGAVQLDQPQYQASELLIGAISRGFRVVERPATIHRRQIGQSKKGHNFFYGLRFAGVVLRTWWRERRRGKVAPLAERTAGAPGGQPVAEPARTDDGSSRPGPEDAGSRGSGPEAGG
jgi:glycosyltransferase involved in cell wall biosynthesis